MLKSERIAIGADSIEVTQWGARVGADMLLRVSRMLGPAMAVVVEAGGVEGLDLGRVVDSFTKSANAEDLQALITGLEKASRLHTALQGADGRTAPHVMALDVDSYFAGRYPDLIKWIAGGLKLNYADFFSAGARGQASPLAAPAQ